jgi:preprotein translocase YajC subunit
MGRPVALLLMTLTVHWVANVHVYAQETEEKAAVAPGETPSISPVESTAATEEAKVPVGEIKSISLVKEKQPRGFFEEFFGNPVNYLLVLVVCVYVYLMFLQPKAGRKELKEQAEKIRNLKKNDRVVTTSGIHGIVSNINSDAGTITLRVDENSNAKLTIDRNTVRSVLS